MMRLEAGVAVVRPWKAEDAGDLVHQANDRRVWRNLRDAFPHPYRLEDAERFIAAALARSPRTYFAVEVGGRIAGGIGYTLHGDVERVGAEMGYWVGAEFRGRGVATASLRALSRHAFEVHPELRRLYALPFAWNPASARVLEKAGYRLEGTMRQSALKDGQIVDQWLYALLREELPGDEVLGAVGRRTNPPKRMRIAVASDHAGFRHKTMIAELLRALGHEVVDFGTGSEEPVDYPDVVRPAAMAVARGECERGIVLGGSGNGEAMAANRVRGVRCALVWNQESARLARAHNDANMISLGQRLVSEEEARAIVETWLSEPFEGGRHVARVAKLEE